MKLFSLLHKSRRKYQNQWTDFYVYGMILSRAEPLLRLTGPVVRSLLQGSNRSNLKQSVRTKVWVQYRNSNPPDDYLKLIKKPFVIFGAALWWWIIWRAVSEFEVLKGPHIPDMSEWTDEELGIPPLDEDP